MNPPCRAFSSMRAAHGTRIADRLQRSTVPRHPRRQRHQHRIENSMQLLERRSSLRVRCATMSSTHTTLVSCDPGCKCMQQLPRANRFGGARGWKAPSAPVLSSRPSREFLLSASSAPRAINCKHSFAGQAATDTPVLFQHGFQHFPRPGRIHNIRYRLQHLPLRPADATRAADTRKAVIRPPSSLLMSPPPLPLPKHGQPIVDMFSTVNRRAAFSCS